MSGRDRLMDVQEDCAAYEGVSVIVYIQTCAAEKRRRRKRGEFPDPDKRIFINTDVCEGCGDCGVQSNCVSIVPVETELGRKRAVDQSTCNKDFSCVQGFCPSFVTVEGAKIRKEPTAEISFEALPDPDLPGIDGTHNIVITGVGGTGVVTIGAILAMAARLDDKGAGMIEMAGLAQKGGAVHIHLRLANAPQDISAILPHTHLSMRISLSSLSLASLSLRKRARVMRCSLALQHGVFHAEDHFPASFLAPAERASYFGATGKGRPRSTKSYINRPKSENLKD